MANSHALETLLSMAVQTADDAAKHLGITVQTKRDAEQKLSILQNYRNDYAARFQEDLKKDYLHLATVISSYLLKK